MGGATEVHPRDDPEHANPWRNVRRERISVRHEPIYCRLAELKRFARDSGPPGRHRPQGKAREVRYLITGGAGFIGSHLTDALVARGDSVLVLDDLSTGRLENLEDATSRGGLEFVEGSILDETLVD